MLCGCTVGVARTATNVTDAKATLRGEIFSTDAGDVDYWFRYGPTIDYGQTTPRRTIAMSGSDNKGVSEPVTGLEPSTQYHYEVCVQHHTVDPDRVVCAGESTLTTQPSEPAELSVAAEPELYPSFTTSASDYVTRCDDEPVTLDIGAPAGTQVAVDGRPARSGRFSEIVDLNQGQAFAFSTTGGAGAATYHVRCLPTDFPEWTFSRTGQPTVDWTVLGLSKGNARFVTFMDDFGTPVWWLRHIRNPLDASVLEDGTVAFARGSATPFGTDDTAYEIRRLDGTIVRELKTVGTDTDHHELQLLANGNYVILSYKPRDHVDLSAHGGPSDATVLDAVIQELTPSGSLVWEWNSKDHIPLADTGPWWSFVSTTAQPLPDGRPAYDIVHINSVEPDGDGLIISLRHTNAIYRIRRSDGGTDWKLGGTATAQSLTIGGDSASPTFSGQHDARRLSDGTITVYDNGTQPRRLPRAVRFSVDATAKTATRLESHTDPEVTLSPCCGSARKLPSGGWLIGWGDLTNPVVGEYTSAGTRLFKLRFPTVFSYRAFPVPPGQVSAAQLRAGMEAMSP